MTTLAALYSAMGRLNQVFGGATATPEVWDGIVRLKSDVGQVANALSATNSYTNFDSEVNRLVREVAYDIEDWAERFVFRQEESASNLWRFFYPCYEKSFVEDLAVLSRRARALIDLMDSSSSSKIDKHNSPSSTIENLTEPLLGRRKGAISGMTEIGKTTLGRWVCNTDGHHFYEPVVIGLQGYVEKLTEALLGGGGSGLSVTLISGMAGVGKTTLARWVCNLTPVRKHFDCILCPTVTFGDSDLDIITAILINLCPEANHCKLAAMDILKLLKMFFNSLRGKRYLVILDDVWSTHVRASVLCLFPDYHNGSRILITSRSKEFAHCNFSSPSHIEMKMLTPEQSWQLFLIKSGLQLLDNPEGIREKVVRSCRGLPLALTVFAHCQNWEQKLKYLHSMNENADHVMDLSYLYLESWLKPCFLYMGLFPPNQFILVEKLHLLWMAEGFISNRMESGEDCFSELVNRNLVILEKKEDLMNSRRLISGRLHDLIRDLCIFRGENDDFFKVIDSSHARKVSSSTCRLAIYLNKCKGIMKGIPRSNCMRSILFFDTVERMAKPRKKFECMAKPRKRVADLTNCQQIRILSFDGVNFEKKKLPRGIGKLIYLRHLSFQGCYLLDFPSYFGNFPFLETLDLRVIESCVMTIPNVLRKLSRLRHLYFPLAFRCATEDKLKLDGLKNLEVLENFHADSCDAGDLLMLENLKILKVTATLKNVLESKTIIKAIKNMKSICHSSLVVKIVNNWSTEKPTMLSELLECSVLHELDLQGFLFAIPRDITFGSNFSKLVFDKSEFQEDPMPILGKLPNLRSLALCNDAVVGLSMVCYESDFPQLTSLKLANLRCLGKWDVESGAMPNLTILTVERCGKLAMLPSELGNIPTLRVLKVGSMSDDFQLAVKKLKYGNKESSITFYEC